LDGRLTPVRRFLAVIYILGSFGLAAELVLLGHVDDAWQWVPFVLMTLGLGAIAWNLSRPSAASLRVFRAVALLLVVGGMVGMGLHYQSNVEFELEMYPDLQGARLIREALTGAIPALAPGALIQLGLVGLAYAYKEAHS
jgi:hypothetical protein